MTTPEHAPSPADHARSLAIGLGDFDEPLVEPPHAPQPKPATSGPTELDMKIRMQSRLASYHARSKFPGQLGEFIAAECTAMGDYLSAVAGARSLALFEAVRAFPPPGLVIAKDGQSWTPDEATRKRIADLELEVARLRGEDQAAA